MGDTGLSGSLAMSGGYLQILPSLSGSNVWIISWKMLFLIRLLCREAELPPLWRRGLACGGRGERGRVDASEMDGITHPATRSRIWQGRAVGLKSPG